MPFPLIPVIGGALSALGLFGGGGGGSSSTKEGERLRRLFMGEIEKERGIARGGPSQARKDFDPYGALQQSLSGAAGLILPEFEDRIMDITGGAVGAGRLPTGFFGEDLRRGTRPFVDRFANYAKTGALQASGQQLRNIEGGESTNLANRGLFFDALLGGLDLEQARKNAEQRSKSSFWGTLGGVGGSLLGLGKFNPYGGGGGGGWGYGGGM